MRNVKVYIVLSILILFISCVTNKTVPITNLDIEKFYSENPVPSEQSLVYIFRPRAFGGSGLKITFFNETGPVGTISSGEFLLDSIEPGRHKYWYTYSIGGKPVTSDPIIVYAGSGSSYFLGLTIDSIYGTVIFKPYQAIDGIPFILKIQK